MPAATALRIALTPREAAAAIGVSSSTLKSLLRTDAGLRRCRRYLTPRCPRFDAARLASWLSSRPDTAHPREAVTA